MFHLGKNTIIFSLLPMKKNKNFNQIKISRYSNSKLLELIVKIFKENPNKRLNYKQIAKILKVKEMGVKIEENGKTTVGQAADTDTLVASANAYLSALNKLIIKRKKTAPDDENLSVQI